MAKTAQRSGSLSAVPSCRMNSRFAGPSAGSRVNNSSNWSSTRSICTGSSGSALADAGTSSARCRSRNVGSSPLPSRPQQLRQRRGGPTVGLGAGLLEAHQGAEQVAVHRPSRGDVGRVGHPDDRQEVEALPGHAVAQSALRLEQRGLARPGRGVEQQQPLGEQAVGQGEELAIAAIQRTVGGERLGTDEGVRPRGGFHAPVPGDRFGGVGAGGCKAFHWRSKS